MNKYGYRYATCFIREIILILFFVVIEIFMLAILHSDCDTFNATTNVVVVLFNLFFFQNFQETMSDYVFFFIAGCNNLEIS